MKSVVLPLFLFTVCAFVFASPARAHPAWAIVVDEQNTIYLSDLEKIWKIDSNGAVSVFSERHTHELALDADGSLLGEELHYEPSTQKFISALWRITPGGEFSYTLAPTETPPKGASIWKNREGSTFYFGQTETEPKEFYLLKRNPNGAVSVLFGDERKALAQRQVVPYSSAGMFFGADGVLYFKNADTVWKAVPDDKITVIADRRQLSAVAPDSMLFGLTVDRENNVYTADYNGKTVLKIAFDKTVSAIYQSEKDWSPTGVYARNKNLFVLENKHLPPGAKPVARVRKIAPNGIVSTVATVGAAQTNFTAEASSPNSPASVDNKNQPVGRADQSCLGVGLVAACACFLLRRQ